MASGTGNSSVMNAVPVESNSSLLHNSHPISLPNSMGGNTGLYESKGGYVPGVKKPNTKRGTKHGGRSNKRRVKKNTRSTKSKRSKK